MSKVFLFWRLTWTLLDTERSVGVLGSGVVLQLERCGVVHKRLGALGHAGAAVVEIGASLQRAHDHGQLTAADGDRTPRRGRGVQNVARRDAGGCGFRDLVRASESITAAFHFYAGRRQANCPAAPRLAGRQIGEKLEPLIHSHDVNGEMVPYKPLKCFVMTQAEATVIELDEPSCELQRQYHPCWSVLLCTSCGNAEKLIKAILIGTLNHRFVLGTAPLRRCFTAL